MKPVSLEPIVSVTVERSPFEQVDLSEFPWQARYNSLKNAYKREIFSIVVEDTVVGAMLVQYDEKPELVFFEVEPRWRGKGVGQAALEILFDKLRRRYFDRLIVQTGRPEIYSGMGFRFTLIDQGHIEMDINADRTEIIAAPDASSSFIYSSKYLVYDYPDHPENDGRVAYMMTRLKKDGLLRGANMFPPRAATEEEILKIHTKELTDRIRTCSQESKPVTRDTPTGPDTFELASLSLGGALMAGELVERHHKVFVLCRPPGHHATRDRAGGFCFFNNMAALAISLWDKGYRPMIVDWDVHHGNGTQEILYKLPIMYVSFHQKYLYPHTGLVEEIGEGDGLNYTKNFPLPIGMKDQEYLEVFGNVRRIADDLRPDIILVSAGQDAHHLDRLSGLRLSSEAFREMGRTVGDVANKHCDGRLILLLEGGYHLEANAEALSFAIMGIRENNGIGGVKQ
jgi:acetoin utilization deacetylase AcuC-like enzyme/GNAT superfamily N-acetyltransferase